MSGNVGLGTNKGSWNALTNAPAISNSTQNNSAGDYYTTSVAGTSSFTSRGKGQYFAVGDIVVFNGAVWTKNDQFSAEAGFGTPSNWKDAYDNHITSGTFANNVITLNQRDGGSFTIDLTGVGGSSVLYRNTFEVTNGLGQNSFTLSTAIDHEDKTQVFIDGVYQQKTGYSVSGTTLSFDDGVVVPDGSFVEIISFSSVALTESLANAKIFVGDSNANAIARTVSGDATLANTGALTLNTVPLAKGGTGATSASAARTSLGLGSVATTASTDYATAAQGTKADTAQQPPSEGAFANGDKTKLDAIEASADVTDATNVTSAGALMDSEVTNLTQVKAFDSTDYATAAQGTKADTAHGWGDHGSGGYITGITSGSVTTALGFTPYNATNPSGFITGITSSNVTTALGFTPYNSTNPSGYITSADGGNASTLDGIDSSQFLRKDGNDTFNGNLTVGSTTRSSNTVVRVLSNDSHNAGFEAYGNSQGTGYLYVGQDASYGGGISYNGDGSPLFAMYESADKITFFRRDNNTTREVFSYPYNTDTVTFNGAIYATNGNFSGNIIGKSDNTTEVGTYSTGAIKRIRMTQGGEIHFGDTTTSNFLGLTEGAVNNFGDQDRLGLYCRNELKIYGNSNLLKVTIPTSGNITFAEGATFGGSISASNLSGTNTGDQSYVATSGSALTLDDGNNQWNWATGSHAYAPNSLRLWDQYSSLGGSGNPTTYGSILHFSGRSGHMDSQLYFGSSGELLYRYNFYGNNNWNAWQTLVTSNNYTSYIKLPAASNHFPIGDGLSTTGKIKFGTDSWGNNIGLESYWMVLGSNSNEGFKFKDDDGNELLKIHGNTNSAGKGLKIGAVINNTASGSWFGTNHAYPTSELKGYGAEFMIGAMNTSIHINYRTCNGGTSGHTPTDWFWRAGSSTSYSNHSFGNVNAYGQITSHAADIERGGLVYSGSTYYISLSGSLSGNGTNALPTLKTNFAYLYFDVSGVYTGYIGYNTGFVDQSDRSLKENIEDIPDALSKVMNLRGRYFTWKNELQSNERQVGFIAQEVEEQLPEVVDNGGGDTKGIAYGKVTALLVNAIKEQQTIIEDLKSRIETLEG
jgi:hypothetical protein